MNRLFSLSNAAKLTAPLNYIRPIYREIDWEGPLNALLGSRGVGKTSLLLQRLVELDMPARQALYVDLGDVYFQENRLFDFIEAFLAQGGKYLLIDEVHRYGYDTWAQELKQAYDLYRKNIKITFTGSSAIRILHQRADLSRRVLQHQVTGLSFREYLLLVDGVELPIFSLQDILKRHTEIALDIRQNILAFPTVKLNDYWKEGYYPFYLEAQKGYLRRLAETIQLVLEVDIPSVKSSGNADYQKLSRLLFAIASSVPFTPNISKLAERLGIGRDTLLTYLQLLEDANLIIGLRHASKGVAALGKPDKIFLNNPNLLYALAPREVDIGTIRETFFLNQLIGVRPTGGIIRPEIKLPKKGDFFYIDEHGEYLFEIGGPNKKKAQIGPGKHHFTVIDTLESHLENSIPLWMFGFLY